MSARVKRKPIKRRAPPRTRLPQRPVGVPITRGRVSIQESGRGLLPKGSASNLPKQFIRKGLRKSLRTSSKENVAGRTIRQTEFAQRTGIQPETFGSAEFKFPSLFGGRRRRTKVPRTTAPSLFGGRRQTDFRMDGLGL